MKITLASLVFALIVAGDVCAARIVLDPRDFAAEVSAISGDKIYFKNPRIESEEISNSPFMILYSDLPGSRRVELCKLLGYEGGGNTNLWISKFESIVVIENGNFVLLTGPDWQNDERRKDAAAMGNFHCEI